MVLKKAAIMRVHATHIIINFSKGLCVCVCVWGGWGCQKGSGTRFGGRFIGALGLRWGHFFGIGVGVHRGLGFKVGLFLALGWGFIEGLGFKVGSFFGTGVGVHRGL